MSGSFHNYDSLVYNRALTLACQDAQAYRDWDCPSLLFDKKPDKRMCDNCKIDDGKIPKEEAQQKIIKCWELFYLEQARQELVNESRKNVRRD